MRLIDGDRLIEWLDENKDRRILNEHDIRFIVNELVSQQWISVKDRLPDAAGTMVLVCGMNTKYHQQHIFEAFQGYGDFKWYTYDVTKMDNKTPEDNEVYHNIIITHWMPLPDAIYDEVS